MGALGVMSVSFLYSLSATIWGGGGGGEGGDGGTKGDIVSLQCGVHKIGDCSYFYI
jgi:hypothetical protein